MQTQRHIRDGPSKAPDFHTEPDESTILQQDNTRRYDGEAGTSSSSRTARLAGSNIRPPITSLDMVQPTGQSSHQGRKGGPDDSDDDGEESDITSHRPPLSRNITQRSENPRTFRFLPTIIQTAWSSVTDRYSSIELENKGSVARDHLALERTFLAWVRTSLSFASIGIAVTQLFRLNTTILAPDNDENDVIGGSTIRTTDDSGSRLKSVGKPLGGTFLGVAILTLFVGFHRYFESQHYVMNGRFPASRGSVLLLTFVSGSLIVSSLVVVLAVGAGKFED